VTDPLLVLLINKKQHDFATLEIVLKTQ